MKLNYKQTFLIGFGFFASSLAWSMYNVYVPILLENYLTSTFLIGLIMTIDNAFGVVFQPIFGTLSDKTNTKYGRRMPYILIGIPICAIAFSLIPFTFSLASLMAVVIIFNFVMSTWRAPVVALMPDVTPPPLRSKANGVINFMGGLGSLFSFFVGGILFKIGGMPLPFIASAVVMVLAGVVLKLFVKEDKYAQNAGVAESIEDTKAQEKESSRESNRKKFISLLLILFAILFWFSGYNAVETFFSLYVTNTLTNAAGDFLTAGDAAILLGIFSVTFLLFSIPAGFIGSKIGRRKTILIGLAGVSCLFIAMLFTGDIWALRVLLFFGGGFWACVNINSLPMVVELANWNNIGKYTGYYYFFSFGASIISPILFGQIRDMVGNYDVLFIYAPIAFILAFICMLFVKHGEVEKDEVNEITV